ncbi:RNA-dependent RNA polymerase [Soybean blotchy mosaic virus]|nr:RNA-dependent RNA polymerase [Soybean blotchy mosaic virus]
MSHNGIVMSSLIKKKLRSTVIFNILNELILQKSNLIKMDIFGEENERAPTMAPIGDFHLRSALIIPNLTEFSRDIIRPKEKIAWRRLSEFQGEKISEPPAVQLGMILRETTSCTNTSSPEINLLLERIESESKYLVHKEITSVQKLRSTGDTYDKSWTGLKDNNFLNSISSEFKIRLMAAVQYSVSRDSERNVEGLNDFFHGCQHGCPILKIGNVVIILAGELIGLVTSSSQETDYLINQGVDISKGKEINVQYLDTLRLISDKISGRNNVLIASLIGELCNPTLYPSPKTVCKILDIFDRGLIEHGNDFYKAIKVYEALVVGLTLQLENTGYISDELNYLENTLKDSPVPSRGYCIEMVKELRHSCFTFHHLSQAHGLFRLWGHPVIDSLAGVEKMRKVGTKMKTTDKLLPIQMGRKFKEKFCLSYFKKNRAVYPNLLILEHGSYLVDCLENNKKINTSDPDYHEQDWDHIEFRKTLEIPESYNLSLIVADTAISPNRAELKSVENDRRGALKPEWRRGVIKWIKDGMIDCLLLLLIVNLCPTGLPLIWLIIGLYPKEREVNPVARMFSLMTLMMRAYFVITEEMLSKHVLKHFPNISMTLPLLDLTKKLNLFTRRQQSQKPGGRTFCINMDFEKWNLNFRKEVTFHVFDSLGRLFGLTHLYNRTYDIFRNSLLYLSDGSYMPKFDDQFNWVGNRPENCIQGHLGGNEGLRQKAWTIATSLMIDIVCEEEKVDYKLMGQGDNQVLLVTIYSEKARLLGDSHQISKDEIKRKLNNFLTKLYQKSKAIGLPIKPLETWVSDTFFAYGKLPVFKGVVGAQSLKKLARCFAFSNEDIMTMDNALGSITATFAAACAADRNSAVPLWIAKINQVLAIEWFSLLHPLGSIPFIREQSKIFTKCTNMKTIFDQDINKTKLPERIILRAMTIVPKMLGGFNTFNLLGSHYRGIPDPLTHSLTVLKLWLDTLASFNTQDDRMLLYALESWYRPIMRKNPRYHQLNSDPYSIPIYQPVGTKMITQRMVRNQVKSISGNSKYSNWFHQLVSITEDVNKERLTEVLTNSKTLYPRLNYAVLKGSVYGYAESVVSKVDKTVTLSRLTSSKYDVVGTIWEGEMEFWRYFFDRSELKTKADPQNCITRYAQYLRDHGWEKEILGVTCPCSYTLIKQIDSDFPERANYIESRTEVNTLLHRQYLDNFCGTSVPYLGSEVEEGQTYNASRVTFGTDPLLSRPVSLMRLINWLVSSNSNWAELLTLNLQSVTDASSTLFVDHDPLFEANSDQKFVDGSSQRGSMWNHLYSVGSHVSINTALWDDAGNKGQYHIQFQSMICMIQEAMLNNITGSFPHPKIQWKTDCKECLIPAVDKIPDIEPFDKTSLFPINRENPYLFIQSSKIVTKVDQKLEELKEIQRVSIFDTKDPPRTAERLIAEHYAWEMGKRLLQNKSSEESVEQLMGTNILELRKLNLSLMMKCLSLILWTSVFSRTESSGRIPNWTVDKELIIKKLLKLELSSFKGGLSLFQDDVTVKQLRSARWFSPPSSYPVNISHGLVSIKSSVILYLKSQKEAPFHHWSLAVHRKELNWYRSLYVRRFVELNRDPNSCHDCKWTIATSHWSDYGNIKDMLAEQCLAEHNIFHSGYIRKSRLITDQWDEILQAAILRTVELQRRKKTTLNADKLSKLRDSFLFQGMTEESFTIISNDPFLELPIITYQYDYTPYILSPISLPTRAYCRIYELMSQINYCDMIGQTVVILGDGFGGSSIAAGEILGFDRVMCWTLLDNSDSLPKSSHTAIPPSHYLDSREILNLSNRWYGDIFSQEFQSAWNIDEDLIGTTCIVSEIELNHYPEERSLNMTIDQCCVLLKLNKLIVIIKVAVQAYTEILNILDATEDFPYTYQVIQTPLVDLEFGECWLVFVRRNFRKKRGLDNKEGKYRLSRYLDVSLNKSNHYLNQVKYQNAWKEILLVRHPLLTLGENDATGWFATAGIVAWNDLDATLLLNQIRNFKCPEYIYDHSGRQAKYWFHEDAEVLKLRLLCLILARMESPQYINELLQNRDGFAIKWKKKSHQNNKISYPMLVRHKENPLSEEQVNVLAKYIAVVRYQLSIKRTDYATFYEIKESVPFKYLSLKHFSGVKKEAFFRISKNYQNMIEYN